MKNVFVTGATGNIGKEVIRALLSLQTDMHIIAGVRDIPAAKKNLGHFEGLAFRTFDFENQTTFERALNNIDLVFLLRPPHISDIEPIFTPLLKHMQGNHIHKVVFLSVQGAEKSKIIPHNKIELLLNRFNFQAVMLRPSYFMQNLTTTLHDDLKNRAIVLPSGKAKFNWIDIRDIGAVAAATIHDFNHYVGRTIELTGLENLSYPSVTASINTLLKTNIKYNSVNPLKYYVFKKKKGYKRGQVMVMLLLHLLPRFQKEPTINDNIEKIIGRPPTSIHDFILNHKDIML